MKKIYLLTFHKESSFGAHLQTYALCRALRGMGCEVSVINLSINYKRRDKPTLWFRIRHFLGVAYYCLHLFEFKTWLFRRKYYPPVVGRFDTQEQLSAHKWNKGATYVVGSDQVWSQIAGKLRPVFFFSFLPELDGFRRISYAASFGECCHMEDGEKARLKDLISRFSAVSVRESSGIQICKEEFRVDAVQVLDPTLLHREYPELVKPKRGGKAHITCFNLSNNKGLYACAREIAQEKGFKLRKMYGGGVKVHLMNLCQPSITKWVRNIATADLVITDSFHGLAFSIVFKRNFLVYQTNEDKIKRLRNLLSMLGMEHRIITPDNDWKTILTNEPMPDYGIIDERLERYREESWIFLKNSI